MAAVPRGSAERPSPLLRDAFVTIATRFGLAILIFGTDIVLARLLGPVAKGRFTIVLLYSQLFALVLAWGTDQALGVIAGRDREAAKRGLANAVVWAVVVGGFGMVLSAWAYGLGHPGPPDGPLVPWLNLSARQFVYAAMAIPGELFFTTGLYALLGRRQVIEYSAIRLLRRALLLVLMVTTALVSRLNLDAVLVLNLVALAATAAANLLAAARGHYLGLRLSPALLAESLRFGTKVMPGALAERLQFRADAFLVNAIIGIQATGIYSVTSGLAETLWYIPNALGIVMFSRAVDPGADAGRVASVLTRATLAVALVMAIPTFILGPRFVRAVYGTQFADAGVALRYILPGIVAYSVVAVLTRYITGRGRPGITTLIMLVGLATNVTANLILIPRMSINGAALSSSISYGVTALITLVVFRRISGRGLVETIVVRPSDIRAVGRAVGAVVARLRGRTTEPVIGLRGEAAADLVMEELEPGDER